MNFSWGMTAVFNAAGAKGKYEALACEESRRLSPGAYRAMGAGKV